MLARVLLTANMNYIVINIAIDAGGSAVKIRIFPDADPYANTINWRAEDANRYANDSAKKIRGCGYTHANTSSKISVGADAIICDIF